MKANSVLCTTVIYNEREQRQTFLKLLEFFLYFQCITVMLIVETMRHCRLPMRPHGDPERRRVQFGSLLPGHGSLSAKTPVPCTHLLQSGQVIIIKLIFIYHCLLCLVVCRLSYIMRSMSIVCD